VHRRRSVTRRVRAGFVPAYVLAIAAPACLLVSGCSPVADYPSIFPSIHDMPPPRADTPLDPDQVQQATEDLITERNHLGGGSQGPRQAKTPANSSANAVKLPAAKKPAGQAQTAATGRASGDAPAASPGAATDGAQTAGAETKP
jgi:hypothetical protein